MKQQKSPQHTRIVGFFGKDTEGSTFRFVAIRIESI